MSPTLLPPDYRVVYLILAHRAPAQVARLVRRLYHRQSRVWVHVDRRADEAAFRRFLAPLGVRFVRDRQAVYWGTFSLVAAMRAGMRAIRAAGEGFDHLVVLSGQDYPLVGTQALLTTLAAHRTESLVSYAALGPDNNPHLLSRLTKYHLPLPGQRALVYPFEPGRGGLRAVLNAALRLTGWYPLPRPLPLPWAHLYFGSNWVRLRPEAVDWVLDQPARYPAIDRFFRRTRVPDEHYFQTLLLNATDAERGPVWNTNLTFSHWHRPAARYAEPLGWDDRAALGTSGCLFARKFDETADGRILDWLDAESCFTKTHDS